MNELWLTVSKYVQAGVFGALTLGFGYYVFNGWLGSLVEAVDALEATIGPFVVFLKFFLTPAYFFRSLFALFLAAKFSWAVTQCSLVTNEEIYGSFGPPDQVADHREMARLSLLSAFWICVRFVVPSVMGAVFYYVLLRTGVVIAMIAASCTFVVGTYIARDFYKGFLKAQKPQLRSRSAPPSRSRSRSRRRTRV